MHAARLVPVPVRTAAARLRSATWHDQIKMVYLTFFGGMLFLLCMPSAWKPLLRPLVLAACVLPLIAKDLAHLPDAIDRVRHALAERRPLAIPAALLPPELLGLLRLDRALRRGFMDWLLRRPTPAQPAGQAFGYLEQGSYRTAFAIVVFSCLVELPLDAAIVPLLVHSAAARQVIHLLMFATVASTLVWALGDRRLIGAGRHLLTDDGLLLQLGARTSGLVPLAAIAACEQLREPPDAWYRRQGFVARQVLLASPLDPLDKPNTVLILHPDSSVRLNHLGVDRTGLRCVFLYLDRPASLVHTVQARCAAKAGDAL